MAEEARIVIALIVVVILVLENSEIIERGDHADLLEQKGRYFQLYTGQYELS